MSRAQYSGLCIGGPMARQMAACEDSRLYVEIREPFYPSLSRDELPPRAPVARARVLYTFADFWRADNSGREYCRGFWIPSDVRADHLLHAVDELAKDYMAGADKVAAERERCARIVERGLGLTNTQIARMIREGGA